MATPQLPVANVVRSVAQYSSSGFPATIVFHHHVTPSVNQGDCVDIANAVFTALKNRFLPLQSNNLQLNSVTSIDLTAGSNLGFRHTEPGRVGAIGDEVLALQAAALLSWNIGSFYRGGKPRTYIPGVPDQSVPDGRSFTNTDLAIWQAASLGLFTDLSTIILTSGHSATFVVVHRFAGKVELNPPTTEQITAASSLHQVIATQRRRLAR